MRRITIDGKELALTEAQRARLIKRFDVGRAVSVFSGGAREIRISCICPPIFPRGCGGCPAEHFAIPRPGSKYLRLGCMAIMDTILGHDCEDNLVFCTNHLSYREVKLKAAEDDITKIREWLIALPYSRR